LTRSERWTSLRLMSNRKGIFGNDKSNNPRSRYFFFFVFPFKTPPLLKLRIGEMKIKKKAKSLLSLLLSRSYSSRLSLSDSLWLSHTLSLRSFVRRSLETKFFSEKKRERLGAFFVRMMRSEEREREREFFSIFVLSTIREKREEKFECCVKQAVW